MPISMKNGGAGTRELSQPERMREDLAEALRREGFARLCPRRLPDDDVQSNVFETVSDAFTRRASVPLLAGIAAVSYVPLTYAFFAAYQLERDAAGYAVFSVLAFLALGLLSATTVVLGARGVTNAVVGLVVVLLGIPLMAVYQLYDAGLRGFAVAVLLPIPIAFVIALVLTGARRLAVRAIYFVTRIPLYAERVFGGIVRALAGGVFILWMSLTYALYAADVSDLGVGGTLAVFAGLVGAMLAVVLIARRFVRLRRVPELAMWALLIAWPWTFLDQLDRGGFEAAALSHLLPLAIALLSAALVSLLARVLLIYQVITTMPWLVPIALILLVVPLFSEDLWEVTNELHAGRVALLALATVVPMLLIVVWQLLVSSLPRVIQEQSETLRIVEDPDTPQTGLGSDHRRPDAPALVMRELERVLGSRSRLGAELKLVFGPILQAPRVRRLFARPQGAAQDAGRVGNESILGTAFSAPAYPFYARYSGARMMGPFRLQILGRVILLVLGIASGFCIYMYVIAWITVSAERARQWLDNDEVATWEAAALGVALPTGPHLWTAAVMGVIATAIFLALVTTNEEMQIKIAESVTRGPVERGLLIAIPYVHLGTTNEHVVGARPITGLSGRHVADGEAGGGDPRRRSAWYAWKAPATGTARFDTAGSTADTFLAVWTGSALDALALTASADGAPGDHSRVRFHAEEGETYRIAVEGFSANGALDASAVVLNWGPNDTFATAQELVGDTGVVHGTNRDSSVEAGEPRHAGHAGGASVWYRWKAPESGLVALDTAGSDFDTLLAVYVGSRLGDLSAASPDGRSASADRRRGVQFRAAADKVYTVAVDGAMRNGGLSRGEIALRWEAADERRNDDLSRAETIDGPNGTAYGENRGATKEPGEPDHAGHAGGASIWYRWRADANGLVSFDTVGSSFDTLLAVYEGSAIGDLEPIEANDDEIGKQSKVSFLATAGAEYLIAVDGYGLIRPATGDVVLNWVANASAEDAVPIAGRGGVVRGSNAASGGGTVWYRWEAPAAGPVAFDVSGSAVPLTVAVGTGPGPDHGPTARFDASPGTVYWIAVGAADAVTGPFELGWLMNDDFSRAERIEGIGGSVRGSTAGATKEPEEPEHSGNAGGASVWYRWRAPDSGPVTFDTAGSAFDTVLAVYTGSALGDLAEIAANDDDPRLGRQSRVHFEASAGVEYHVAVDGYRRDDGVACGELVVNWVMNDDFQAAQQISGTSGSVHGCNVGAQKEPDERAHARNAGGASVWYRWTAPETGRVTFDTAGSAFDTLLAVYRGSSVDKLQEVAANDDAIGLQSRVTFAAERGVEYHVAVDGFKSGSDLATGPLVLSWSTPPPNDDLAAAVTISGPSGRVSGTTLGATKEPDEAAHAGTVGGASVWYRWQAPASGPVAIALQECDFDAVLAVYAEKLGSHVEIASSAAAAEGEPVRVDFAAIGGGEFLVAVDGRKGDDGRIPAGVFTLVWRANDNVAAAASIEGPEGVEHGDNRAATKEPGEPDHAGRAGAASVWYRWVAPTDGSVTFTTTGSSFDTLLAVYTGTGIDDLVEVASNDDDPGGGTQSRVRFAATQGTEYLIAVDGYRDATGDIVLGWGLVLPPENESFEHPFELTEAVGRLADTNLGAGKEDGEPIHAGKQGGSSVWYRWTAPETGYVTIDTQGSSFDTLLAVYVGSRVDELVEVASNDDDPAGGTHSRVRFPAVEGTVYAIAVDGYGGAQGDIVLTLDRVLPPANDRFDAATVIEGRSGTIRGRTYAAGREEGEPEHAGRRGGASVWYRWTAPEDCPVTFSTEGSTFDTLLAVYTGASLDELVEVDSNDDDPAGGTHSRVRFHAEAGTEYAIAVDGLAEATGDLALNWLGNDDLAAAQRIEGAYGSLRASNRGATKEPDEPPHAGNAGGASVWYMWRATVSGPVSMHTGGSNFDTLLAVYTGATIADLVEVAANDDDPTASGPYSRVRFDAIEGTEYAIAVDGFGGAHGELELTWLANDAFAGAHALTGPEGRFDGDNWGATKEPGEPQHAGNSGGASIWCRWRAPQTGTVTFHTAGSSFDTLLAVYTGTSVDRLAEVAANDDYGGGRQSRVTFQAQAEVEYAVAVDGFGGAQGEIVLGWTLVPPPRNDALADAEPLAESSGTLHSTNLGATKEAGEPDHAGNAGGASIWYRWTAPETAQLAIDTAGSSFDTLLAVYTGSAPGELVEVASNDDAAGMGTASRVVFSATAGTALSIAVDGHGGATGDVVLSWNATRLAENDAFADAEELQGASGEVRCSTIGTTKEPGEPNHAGNAGGASVWYRWTAPASGVAAFETEGSSFDTLLAVYTGSDVAALTPVAADDDALGLLSRVTFDAIAGAEYRIVVDGFDGEVGDVVLSWGPA